MDKFPNHEPLMSELATLDRHLLSSRAMAAEVRICHNPSAAAAAARNFHLPCRRSDLFIAHPGCSRRTAPAPSRRRPPTRPR